MNLAKQLKQKNNILIHSFQKTVPKIMLLGILMGILTLSTPLSIHAQSKQKYSSAKHGIHIKQWFSFMDKPMAAIQKKIDQIGYKKTIQEQPIAKVQNNATKKEVIATNKPISKAKSSEKIKINLPKITKAQWQQIKQWTGNMHHKLFGAKAASKTTIRKIKKTRIESLNDKRDDIQLALEQLENKKEQLLQHKERIEKSIAVLNNPDSVKTVLAAEIHEAELRPTASMTVPVGFTDLDEQIRNLQLLEKIPSNYALTIRPFITDTKLNYAQVLKSIDSNINYQGTLYRGNNTVVTLLPISFTQKINTDHPYGWNDGAMSYSKGYQYQIGAGVFAAWRKIKVQFKPEYVHTAHSPYETNGDWGLVTTSYKKLTWGQSALRVDLGKISIAATTENIYWGPGIFNSLVMSNNAEGFFHYTIKTNRPIKNFLGTFEFQLIAGKLTMDSSQGFENFNLKKRAYLVSNDRYINGLNLAYQPAFMKNVSFGINRIFYNNMNKDFTGAIPTYLPVIGSFFGSAYNDTINRDQILSFNTRWVMPKNHAEVYFEFGWNDAKDNFRDLMVDFSHSSAYTFGFKKLAYLNNEQKGAYLDFGAEVTRLAATPSQIMRAAGNWYEHGGNAAYTHQNQLLAAGSGMGNNTQIAYLGWNKGWDKIGIIFKKINQNPQAQVAGIATVGVRSTLWDDFAYGLQTRYRYKNILFSANMEWVDSKNYLWKQGNNVGNFHAFINTVYLW